MKKSFISFKQSCVGVKLVEKCVVLLYCFVNVGNISTQLTSPD